MSEIKIREARPEDGAAIWAMLEPVFRAGETYAIDRDITEADAVAYWTAAHCYIAELEGVPVGTFYIKRNQPGGGAHVCNCGYVTGPGAEGRGVARAMLGFSLDEAKRLGFRAMQYNFVLASNARAITTWQRAGFEIIGRIPEAFDHPKLGLIEALVMYRRL
ncbi:GNAT family N-acetyltransferase [Rhodalgimonas zhirmunskyi]|uniref:GNAT family N-acetyltransferase n=1 Tax=Rhodalgimonas zhirmunskyi TaxID=2964767 RepID=A0AAJ1X8M5_9RHOB|nr:GNAT family N-acetyltransferase [Rhodoalgimonas zhirmunskyi]MDQ2095797.1 GNAT family N-acetyltransferase [Rhodoalgimonas zhirmunskyi]